MPNLLFLTLNYLTLIKISNALSLEGENMSQLTSFAIDLSDEIVLRPDGIGY